VGRPRKFCTEKCYKEYGYEYPETHKFHDKVLSDEVIKTIDDVFNDNFLPGNFKEVDFIPARVIQYTGTTGKQQSRKVRPFNVIGQVTDSFLNDFIAKSKEKIKGEDKMSDEKEKINLVKEIRNLPDNLEEYRHPDRLAQFKRDIEKAVKEGRSTEDIKLPKYDIRVDTIKILKDRAYEIGGTTTGVIPIVMTVYYEEKKIELLEQLIGSIQSLNKCVDQLTKEFKKIKFPVKNKKGGK
jgi:hypothetical protein